MKYPNIDTGNTSLPLLAPLIDQIVTAPGYGWMVQTTPAHLDLSGTAINVLRGMLNGTAMFTAVGANKFTLTDNQFGTYPGGVGATPIYDYTPTDPLFTGTEFTLWAVVAVPIGGFSTGETIYSQYTSGTQEVRLAMTSANLVTWEHGNGSLTAPLVLGAINVIVASCDGVNKIKLRVNGVNKGVAASDNNVPTGSPINKFGLGNLYNTGTAAQSLTCAYFGGGYYTVDLIKAANRATLTLIEQYYAYGIGAPMTPQSVLF